jgi:diguanylate cyclase (GGDEF)-like protein
LTVTVSIGVAESQSKRSVEDIIKEADKALYRAKQGGRNRIEVAGTARRTRKSPAPKPDPKP